MKLLQELSKQVEHLKPIKRAWFTTFNLNMDFFERHVLSTILQMDKPKNRIDYEVMQQNLNGTSSKLEEGNTGSRNVDVAIFADQRMHDASDIKLTAINVYSVNPTQLKTQTSWTRHTLFHPKVIYLESFDGRAVLGCGSANLTLSGWSSNQEVFAFKEVTTQTQRESIKAFFKPLFNDKDISDIAPKLSITDDASWQFIHSFSVPNFLDTLFPTQLDDEQHELAVWSPYFPQDLATFIQNIESYFIKRTSETIPLSLYITPDLFENKQLRTKWTNELSTLIDNKNVRFYEKHEEYIQDRDSDYLCHAKIWMTSSRLAIGSWNFTTPGSNLYLSNREKEQSNINIEAGFVIEHNAPIGDQLGVELNVSKDNFMTDEVLDEHILEVSALLQFDIAVRFDWRSLKYTINISDRTDYLQKNAHKLRLPDIAEITLFSSKDYIIRVEKPNLLITQHAYEIYKDNNLIHRGFILETNSQLRRVEQFTSLNDIFSSLISGVDFGASGDTRLRGVFEKDIQHEDQPELEILGSENRTQSLSYFRIFQAFDEFNTRIRNISDNRQLEQYAFVVPGCLEELKEKIEAEVILVDGSGMNVQSWFLVHEFNLLINMAEQTVSDVDQDLKSRLNLLRIDIDNLEKGHSFKTLGYKKYRNKIQGTIYDVKSKVSIDS